MIGWLLLRPVNTCHFISVNATSSITVQNNHKYDFWIHIVEHLYFYQKFQKVDFFFCLVTHFLDSSLFSSNSVSLFLTHQHLFCPSYNILCLARDSKKYWIFSEGIQSKPKSLFYDRIHNLPGSSSHSKITKEILIRWLDFIEMIYFINKCKNFCI